MTWQPKATLKTYFETGDQPTEAQFSDLIDSLQAQSNALQYIASASAVGSGRFLVSDSTGDGVVFV